MIQPVAGSTSPADVDLDAEAVAVQPGALVALGHERQPVAASNVNSLKISVVRAGGRRADGDSGRRAGRGDRRVHTPVASFHAMTWSCGRTRASRERSDRRPTARRASGSDRRRRRGVAPAPAPACRRRGRAAAPGYRRATSVPSRDRSRRSTRPSGQRDPRTRSSAAAMKSRELLVMAPL